MLSKIHQQKISLEDGKYRDIQSQILDIKREMNMQRLGVDTSLSDDEVLKQIMMLLKGRAIHCLYDFERLQLSREEGRGQENRLYEAGLKAVKRQIEKEYLKKGQDRSEIFGPDGDWLILPEGGHAILPRKNMRLACCGIRDMIIAYDMMSYEKRHKMVHNREVITNAYFLLEIVNSGSKNRKSQDEVLDRRGRRGTTRTSTKGRTDSGVKRSSSKRKPSGKVSARPSHLSPGRTSKTSKSSTRASSSKKAPKPAPKVPRLGLSGRVGGPRAASSAAARRVAPSPKTSVKRTAAPSSSRLAALSTPRANQVKRKKSSSKKKKKVSVRRTGARSPRPIPRSPRPKASSSTLTPRRRVSKKPSTKKKKTSTKRKKSVAKSGSLSPARSKSRSRGSTKKKKTSTKKKSTKKKKKVSKRPSGRATPRVGGKLSGRPSVRKAVKKNPSKLPWLGMQIDVTNEEFCRIDGVVENGPAHLAGIHDGDVLTGFALEAVRNVSTFQDIFRRSGRVGAAVEFKLLRASGEEVSGTINVMSQEDKARLC